MFILEFNPEYNVLKVAGSPAGLKRSPESMLPSLVKNSKATYVYDNKANKLIFVANSRSDLTKFMDLDLRNLSRILKEKSLYLDRFIISSKLLSKSDFVTELIKPEEFFNLISETKKDASDPLRGYPLRGYEKIKLIQSNMNRKRVTIKEE